MEYASRGVGAAGLTTGIIGSALGVFNSGLGGLMNGGGGMAYNGGMGTYQYELNEAQKISELQAGIALRDANVYNDQKMLDLYKYFDSKIGYIEQQISQQSVVNAQITANLACMQKDIDTLQGLTKTIVPISSICPPPMPEYNSWVAPTTAATTTE